MEARTNTKNPKAAGFINLVLIDNNGNRHSFKMGIPLFAEGRKMDAQLLNRPDLLADLEPHQIELKVHVVQEEVEPEF